MYFIEGLSETRIKKINSLGITLSTFPLEISRRKDIKGHLVEENQLDIVLKAIKAEVISKTPSTTEGIVIVKIKNRLKKEVTVSVSLNPSFYWDGYASQKRFRLSCEELLEGEFTKVIFHCVHGREFLPYEDKEALNIYFWSSPIKEFGNNSSSYFNIANIVQDKCLLASNEYLTIEDESGNIPASFKNNHLYIHFDIIHSGSPEEELIFRKILAEFLELKKLSSEEIEKRKKEIINKLHEKNKTQYVKMLSDRYFRQSKNRAVDNTTILQGIQNAETQLHSLYRDLNENQIFIDAVEEKSKTIGEKLLSEYEKIIEMSKIKKVTINGNIISFFTTMIYCVDDRSQKTHEIGEFQIIFDLAADSRGDKVLKFVNLTRSVQTPASTTPYFHPHIPNTGYACQGNMSHTMPRLISDLELEMAVLLAIQFLESANSSDSWGKHIDKWPVKTNAVIAEN